MGGPSWIVFDYGNNILDRTVFYKDVMEWWYQISYSENAIDRIMGIRGLGDFYYLSSIDKDKNIAFEMLRTFLLKDDFWGVKCEAVKELSSIKNEKTIGYLQEAYDIQTHPRVKRAIIEALGNTGKKETADFILRKIQNEKREYIVAEGIEALAKVLPPEEIYDKVISFINIPSHRGVIITAVVKALDSADNKIIDVRIKKALLDVAFGIDVDSRVRTVAINALIQYAKDEDVKLLTRKYVDYNFRETKQALIRLLGESGDKSLIKFLEELNEKTTDEWVKFVIDDSIKKLEG